jgi:hypothetical protein
MKLKYFGHLARCQIKKSILGGYLMDIAGSVSQM